jgi:hypothetical protein
MVYIIDKYHIYIQLFKIFFSVKLVREKFPVEEGKSYRGYKPTKKKKKVK